MTTRRCEWCGQHESNEYPIWGHKESAEASYFISHKTRGYCIMAALARAEAAETRVAELEAQLVGHGWRPGGEKPPVPEWYQVGDIDVGVYELWYSGEAWYRSSFQGATYRTPPLSAPDFWRPIPPLPAPDANEEPTS